MEVRNEKLDRIEKIKGTHEMFKNDTTCYNAFIDNPSPLYSNGFDGISLDVGTFSKVIKRDFENIIGTYHLPIHNNAIGKIELKRGKILSMITDMLKIITTTIELLHRWNIELAGRCVHLRGKNLYIGYLKFLHKMI